MLVSFTRWFYQKRHHTTQYIQQEVTMTSTDNQKVTSAKVSSISSEAEEKNGFIYRPLTMEDRGAYRAVVHTSFNAWYWQHGWNKDYFACGPDEAALFFDVYQDLDPSCSVSAWHVATGQLAGACFYHPRPTHVSLGIMSVAPSFGGSGVGKELVRRILAETARRGLPATRLASSAMNMNSFSLYNKAGFQPKVFHQDMVVVVPKQGPPALPADCETRATNISIRKANASDVAAMVRLEEKVSGIQRGKDFEYAIENKRGIFDVYVAIASQKNEEENDMKGFIVALKSTPLNQLGPGVAEDDAIMTALFHYAFCHTYIETYALCVVPTDALRLVAYLYKAGGKNVETHLLQVHGQYQEIRGINIPSFLPETG